MQVISRDILYREISRHNSVTHKIDSGEKIKIQTELCTGDWLKSIDDKWSPEKSKGPNPASGCIYINGAKPGDMLKIEILDIQVDKLGYTGFAPGMNPFPDWIRHQEWGIVTKTVKIEDGFIRWDDKLKIPVSPMIGLMGTAPALGVPDNSENGRHGGNMDAQEVTTGSTVHLPVFVDGGLLHVGDVHAIQGDGEINCGGGIETRSEVVLRVEVVKKPEKMNWPRIETEEHIMTIGCARPAEDAFRLAVEEMVYWLEDYGMAQPDAYLLLGQILEARCTQFVNPLYTYICKVNKKYL